MTTTKAENIQCGALPHTPEAHQKAERVMQVSAREIGLMGGGLLRARELFRQNARTARDNGHEDQAEISEREADMCTQLLIWTLPHNPEANQSRTLQARSDQLALIAYGLQLVRESFRRDAKAARDNGHEDQAEISEADTGACTALLKRI